MKLYSFSKKSWHVRFFKWLFNEDPTYRYKTMCPYFWTYVLIFLFIIPILIVKMFGKTGTKFLAWTKDYKHNKNVKARQHLIEQCKNPNISEKEAFRIVKSKCWDNYSGWVDDDDYVRIKDLYRKEYWRLEKLEQEAARKRYAAQQKRKREFDKVNKKMSEYKDSKFFEYLSYVVIGAMGLFLLYGLYSLISMIPFSKVPWGEVGYYTLLILGVLVLVAAAIGGGYLLVRYVFIPFFKWLSCVRLPRCGICDTMGSFFTWCGSWMKYGIYIVMPFWWLILGIGKVGVIIGHMIWSTYKKRCPIIEWREE